jgi:hypothetical protein
MPAVAIRAREILAEIATVACGKAGTTDDVTMSGPASTVLKKP